MYYKFNKHELKYVKVNWISLGLKAITGLIFLTFILGWSFKPEVKENYTEDEVMIILAKHNQFSEEKLIEKIKEMNFPFPQIVYAQALLETNHFKSKMFAENHNLFGMKEAVKRINTAMGTQYQHAYYKNWEQSVVDYALYTSRYLYSIDNEKDYLDYLSQNYAEDGNYVNKLKTIIRTEKVDTLFK